MKNSLLKPIKGYGLSLLAAAMVLGVFSPTVQAANPSLQVTSYDNYTYQISVSVADSYKMVYLYSRQSGTLNWESFGTIGSTDGSGSLNATFYAGSGGYYNYREFYVLVNGIQSNVTSANNYGYGGVTFSQTNPSMYVGQSLQISLYGGTGNYYISNNSNSYVVSANLSGSTLYLYANQNGSSTITVCGNNYYYSGSNCGTLYVTVTGNNYGSGNLWFSPSNPTLNVGQSLAVSINSSSGTYSPIYNNPYYISYNSNPSVVSATVSGTVLNLYGYSNGTSTITVAHSTMGWTGTVYVTVRGGSVLGSTTYANGQLVNQGGTICLIYKNTYIAFGNKAAFLGLGYSFNNTIPSYNNFSYSYVVTTQYASHPWGSWVKGGQTVYFVSENGLIPIPSYDIFLNNGGKDSYVVPMNSYDWSRPMLQQMSYNDQRLY